MDGITCDSLIKIIGDDDINNGQILNNIDGTRYLKIHYLSVYKNLNIDGKLGHRPYFGKFIALDSATLKKIEAKLMESRRPNGDLMYTTYTGYEYYVHTDNMQKLSDCYFIVHLNTRIADNEITEISIQKIVGDIESATQELIKVQERYERNYIREIRINKKRGITTKFVVMKAQKGL